jgi:uncharacterized protein YjbJ (UPF0337 family)
MNRDIFDGKWKQVRGAIQQRWGDLSDDDLNTLHGRYDLFVGLLQEKYGHTRERAEKEIEARLSDVNWHETAENAKNRVTTAVKDRPWSVVLPSLVVMAVLGLWLKSAKS